MAQNLSKNTSDTVKSCYQSKKDSKDQESIQLSTTPIPVNLAIDITNITKNYTNSHFFTCHHMVSEMVI